MKIAREHNLLGRLRAVKSLQSGDATRRQIWVNIGTDLNFPGLNPEHSVRTRSIPCLLMPWLYALAD